MLIRRKPNKSGTTSVQVVDKSRGCYRVIKSFGTGRTEAELLSLERKARVTTIEVQTGEAYQVPERLALLLARLPERLFARCHGSFAVGLAHVRLVRKDAIVVDTGTEVPLSRRYAGSFRERYLDWAESHAL